MSDLPRVAPGQTDQAMVRVEFGSAQEQTWPVWPSDQFSAKGAISGDLPSAKPWRSCRAAFPKDGTNPTARVIVESGSL
jgi:hypothetical protein